jgi:hypothetical protein
MPASTLVCYRADFAAGEVRFYAVASFDELLDLLEVDVLTLGYASEILLIGSDEYLWSTTCGPVAL